MQMLLQVNDTLFPQVSRRMFKEERSVLAGFSCWIWFVCPVPKITTMNSLRSHGKDLVAAELAALAVVDCSYASSILGSWEISKGHSLAISSFPNMLHSPSLKEENVSCKSLLANYYCAQCGL